MALVDNIYGFSTPSEPKKPLAYVFGANVLHCRLAQDINKKVFAIMMDVSRPTLDKLERGELDAKLHVVQNAAAALDVEAAYLLTDHNFPAAPPAKKRTS